jgi:hypothetical protein
MVSHTTSTSASAPPRDKDGFDGDQKISLAAQSEVVAISPEGNADVRFVFGDASIALKMLYKGKPVRMIQEIETALQGMARTLKGRNLVVTLSPQARVLKVSGTETLTTALIQSMPARNAFERAYWKEMMPKFVKGLLDDQKGLLQAVLPLPENAVDTGDSWPASRMSPFVDTETPMTTTYTLLSRGNGEARIRVIGTSASTSTKPGQVSPRVILKGTQHGAVRIDETTGWPKSGELFSSSSSQIVPILNGKPAPDAGSTVYNKVVARFSTTPITK